jgi:FAD:protein FMN transferase
MTSRRRFLSVFAAYGALAPLGRLHAAPHPHVSTWRGSALGAFASLTLVHPDRARARRAIEGCITEVARLESIFSLYRPDSALSRLNASGELRNPPQELVELLAFALSVAAASSGAFDPTVQPLYRLHASHAASARQEAPSARELEQVLRLVDYRAVAVEPTRIGFARRGMALTLNGIAQGFITDRVADRLRADGFGNVLVDLGEARALGNRADGIAWQGALRDPRNPDLMLLELPLGDGVGRAASLATSAGDGTRFGDDPRRHHLLDPHTGESANHHASISVSAPRATLADALSTAFFVSPESQFEVLLRRYPTVRAYVVDASGHLAAHGAA